MLKLCSNEKRQRNSTVRSNKIRWGGQDFSLPIYVLLCSFIALDFRASSISLHTCEKSMGIAESVHYFIRYVAKFRKCEFMKGTSAHTRETQARCIAHFVEKLEEINVLSKTVKVSNSPISK